MRKTAEKTLQWEQSGMELLPNAVLFKVMKMGNFKASEMNLSSWLKVIKKRLD